MTKTTTARIGVAALSLAAALALSSCDDFFGNEDLKELIKADVAAATAPSVSVTMAAADKTSMGTPSPIGAQSYKVGIANPITTTVGDDYTFLSWTCTGAEDVDYRFEDAASPTTTVTILNADPETALSIKPTFDRRPYVTIWDPYSGATDYTNKTITITFNEDIDPDSLTLAENGSVQITERSYTDLTDPAEHIESQLDMDIDGSVVTITPRSAADAYSTYNYISITLSTDIADVAGNTMANEFAWFWKTNNGADTAAPSIDEFTITNAAGATCAPAAASLATNGRSIYLKVTASDEQAIPYIRVTETPCDSGGTPVGGATVTVTESSTFASGSPFPLTLAAASDGYTRLKVEVADISGNWTTATGAANDTKIVRLDRTAPTGYSVNISQATINNINRTSASFSFAAAEVGASYSYTFSSAGGGTNVSASGTVGSATQTVSGINLTSLGDGTVTLSVTLTDTAGNTGIAVTDTVDKDTVAPTGYSASIVQTHVNNSNRTAVSFSFAAAEVGASYSYTFSSTGGGTNVTGTDTITSATQTVSGINLTSLGDGTVTLSVALTDAAGNAGIAVTDTVDKDATAPAGYSVNVTQAAVNDTNRTSVSFSFASAEVGASYSYTFSSTGGGTNVTGTDTVTSATQTVSGINLTSLGDGMVTLSVTLTDVAGNAGTPAIDTVDKDIVVPSGYAVSIVQSIINIANRTSVSFSFAAAEVGASYSYTFSSTGGGTNVTGTDTVTSATQTVSGINLTGLGDGTATLSVTLTDAAGNTGITVTDTVDKDATAPAGYSVNVTQAAVNDTNRTSVSFSFAAAEVGASYSYTFSSTGGGTNVTGTDTITSATQTVSGINLTSLGDGTVTLSVTLTDAAGNAGVQATDTVVKDATAPSGYSVNITQAAVNNTNSTAISFSFAAAEVGASYSYTFSSTGGGTSVSASGTVGSATQTVSGINLTGLGDGTVTLSVTLTDAAGNAGIAAIHAVEKDIVVPSGYTAAIAQSIVNDVNRTAISFSFAAAEVGASYSYTFSSTGGGTNVSGSGTVGSSSQAVPGINLTSLGDGTVTLSVTLTDTAGNTGVPATDIIEKDAAAPAGYSASIVQAHVNNTNRTAVSFSFAAAEVGASYTYTFSSTGGGTNVSASGTVGSAAQTVSGIDLTGLGDGTVTLSVTLTDTAGNAGAEASDTVDKDIVAPTVSISSPADNAYISAASTMTVNAGDGALTARLDGYPVVAFESGIDAISTLSAAGWAAIAEGDDVEVTVLSTDVAGNVGSVSRTFRKDTTAPTFAATPRTYAPNDATGVLTVYMETDTSSFSTIQYSNEVADTTAASAINWATANSIVPTITASTTLSATIGIALSNNRMFWYRVLDGAGNPSAAQSVSYTSGGGLVVSSLSPSTTSSRSVASKRSTATATTTSTSTTKRSSVPSIAATAAVDAPVVAASWVTPAASSATAARATLATPQAARGATATPARTAAGEAKAPRPGATTAATTEPHEEGGPVGAVATLVKATAPTEDGSRKPIAETARRSDATVKIDDGWTDYAAGAMVKVTYAADAAGGAAAGGSSGDAPADAPRAPDGAGGKTPAALIAPPLVDGRRRDEDGQPGDAGLE